MSLRLPLTNEALDSARRALLSKASTDAGLSVEPGCSFIALKDGDMDSFAVIGSAAKEGSEQKVADYDYTDGDGAPVLITVYSHDNLTVSSVDFWRVDFEPLEYFPEPSDLRKRVNAISRDPRGGA